MIMRLDITSLATRLFLGMAMAGFFLCPNVSVGAAI